MKRKLRRKWGQSVPPMSMRFWPRSREACAATRGQWKAPGPRLTRGRGRGQRTTAIRRGIERGSRFWEAHMGTLLTEEDVAKHLHVSVASLRRWRVERRGPQYIKVGSLV